MPSRVIKAICDLIDPLEVMRFLSYYRTQESYSELAKISFNEMSDLEATCFVLTRDPKDTYKITSTELNRVIKNIQTKNELSTGIIDSLIITSLAIEFSEITNNPERKNAITQELNYRLSYQAGRGDENIPGS
ncbi:MAG: hypothetical protein H0U71_04880 [Gammaproteobacteria bacterium]|nr:hypothetical protein [Gammaproteobacteria bacterium]